MKKIIGVVDEVVHYAPDEPRDDHGRWTGGGAGALSIPSRDIGVSGTVDRVTRSEGGIYTYHVGVRSLDLSAREHNDVLRHFGLTAETSLTGPVGLRVEKASRRDPLMFRRP